jgi:hypothetical protein
MFQQLPSYESTKSQALDLRAELEATLPAGAPTVRDVENPIRCSDEAAQYGGTLTVGVAADFDSAAWLDEAAALFEDRSGWRVEKKVAADGSSNATSGVAYFSDDGYYLRLDAATDGLGGDPVLVLSASGPCATKAE